ncbi:GNAT family N-acetyltransferase [Bacillus sp. DTU_2020_1000418_1_SI_GHA_SEK_038]|uniref:GNAT family N-acetyltransferase n=1 Tax=Bacillus sp. DTU_2020_1000418_1_SI_GHA_SEK_038 TaxID=3077585 RepID=UPI0028EAC8DD|nr:GNAT family N-acetyltransferase [Bacillus sp. DTU_2020_1000418_1_SI_GHA_SEK_038]WNS76139.1 GNAT family N-acetyltransferase [Bacillus sp. DTU_2020_1000418_1_SI_GHA_SEK_038]
MEEQSIKYTAEVPNPDQLYQLYQLEGWNDFLNLPKDLLHKAMVQSWSVLSAYDREQLIGTGRIISDGLINGYICGVIVHPDYRNKGIGKEIVLRLVEKGKASKLHIQLLSEEKKSPYYEKLGFEVFTVGMKYRS